MATPMMQTPVKSPPGNQVIPFRKATFERTDILPSEPATPFGANAVRIERTIEGSGYIYGILLQITAITAANAAVVVFAEDAPWNILDTVTYRDVNGELINLQGFDLFIANLAMGNYKNRFFDGASATVSQPLFQATAGAGATGGSFIVILRVPVGINKRNLAGIVGNQDRAQKYSLRTDLAPVSATIYATPPTNLPGLGGGAAQAPIVNKFYENYAVPMPKGPNDQPQAMTPPSFGTLHFLTAISADTPPAVSSTINHFLRRIGNTIRFMAFIFKAGATATPRAVAEATPPTNLRLKIGEDTVYNESWVYRKARMFEHYGFDFPNGVLVYDNIHDFDCAGGAELGNDYWHTQAVNNAQLIVAYSAAFVAGSSLRVITDDLQLSGALE
jgi:hypothetical protein